MGRPTFIDYLRDRTLVEMPTTPDARRTFLPYGDDPDVAFLDDLRKVLHAADQHAIADASAKAKFGTHKKVGADRHTNYRKLLSDDDKERGKDKAHLFVRWRYTDLLKHAEAILKGEPPFDHVACPYPEFQGEPAVTIPASHGIDVGGKTVPRAGGGDRSTPPLYVPLKMVTRWVTDAREKLVKVGHHQGAVQGLGDFNKDTALNAWAGIKDRSAGYVRKPPTKYVTLNPNANQNQLLTVFNREYADLGFNGDVFEPDDVVRTLQPLSRKNDKVGVPLIPPVSWQAFTANPDHYIEIARQQAFGTFKNYAASAMTARSPRDDDPQINGMALNALAAGLVQGDETVHGTENSIVNVPAVFATKCQQQCVHLLKKWHSIDPRKAIAGHRERNRLAAAGGSDRSGIDGRDRSGMQVAAKPEAPTPPPDEQQPEFEWTPKDLRDFISQEGRKRVQQDYPDEWNRFQQLRSSRQAGEQEEFRELQTFIQQQITTLGIRELEDYDPGFYAQLMKNLPDVLRSMGAKSAEDFMPTAESRRAAPTFTEYLAWRRA